jgi:RecA-family ATPase
LINFDQLFSSVVVAVGMWATLLRCPHVHSDILQPRLLVLDPFVRLHRIDENASGEVAPLLAYLRELQRRHGVAVVVVHHAKKGAGRIRAGQALAGKS